MNDKRIYGKKYEINTLRTKELYNARADRLGKMKSPYTSVLLGDQNPEYADKWNTVEKELILPLMEADKTKSVLDLGCGIGRWAESLLPLCGSYTGVDFSEGMIEEAVKRCGHLMNDSSSFECDSVQDFLHKSAADKKYDIIITPTSPTTAFKIGEKSNNPLEMYLADICTVPLNIAGVPGMSVPCKLDSEGLPIGFQLIGNHFAEETILSTAYAFEQEAKFREKYKPEFRV